MSKIFRVYEISRMSFLCSNSKIWVLGFMIVLLSIYRRSLPRIVSCVLNLLSRLGYNHSRLHWNKGRVGSPSDKNINSLCRRLGFYSSHRYAKLSTFLDIPPSYCNDLFLAINPGLSFRTYIVPPFTLYNFYSKCVVWRINIEFYLPNIKANHGTFYDKGEL